MSRRLLCSFCRPGPNQTTDRQVRAGAIRGDVNKSPDACHRGTIGIDVSNIFAIIEDIKQLF